MWPRTRDSMRNPPQPRGLHSKADVPSLRFILAQEGHHTVT
jgi:hypothetical protein